LRGWDTTSPARLDRAAVDGPIMIVKDFPTLVEISFTITLPPASAAAYLSE
jgi:hypothetical protein